MIAGEHRLALPAGYQLGKYLFQRILGAGGFGITYLAEDKSLGRCVAIKELLPNDIATRIDGSTVVAKTKSEEQNLAWARDRFLKEGRALAACEHPNVVHVYEMIEANGTAYMVTKFEDGRSFADWLGEVGGAPTEKELRAILLPLLSGLERVHKVGFLHRDLKPENIYITDDGRPLLLDFGSARQAVTDRTTSLTSIVTSGYAPFEQYHEDGKQGTWTDIYAMAAVMYRAIHGKKPPEATRRLKDDPCLKLAKTYAGKYSDAFLRSVDKGLAVEVKERTQTIAEWREALGVEEAEPPPVAAPWWAPYLRKLEDLTEDLTRQARAYPQWAAGAAAAVLVSVWLIWKLSHPVPVPVPMPDPQPHPTPRLADFTPTPTPVVTPHPHPPPIVTPVPQPVVIVTPAPQPEPATPAHLKPNPWETEVTPAPAFAAGVDPGLVGTWSLKVALPSGFVVLHWQQFADGHYVSTNAENNVVIDSGTLTAQGGNIHRISTTYPSADLTYEIKSTKEIITNDPNDPTGPKTWHRVGSSSTKEKSTSTHSRSSNGNGNSGDSGPHINIPSNIRRLLPGIHF